MKQNSYELFKNGSMDEILGSLEESLSKSDEAPIWRERVIPFSKAILSVLIPLRDHHLLFDPQMVGVEVLTPDRITRMLNIADTKSISKYKVQIVIAPPKVFSKLLKVEFK